jgi:hypothetical protein
MIGLRLVGSYYNSTDGNVYPTEVEYVLSESVPTTPVPVDPSGRVVEYTPVSACVSKKTTKYVRPNMNMTWRTTVQYTLPAVLSHFEIDVWEKKNGAVKMIPRPIYSSSRVSRQFPATVVQTWSENPPTDPSVTPIIPTVVSFSIPPFEMTFRTEPCITRGGVINVSVGSEDPVWVPTSGSFRYDASTPTSIPRELVVSDTTSPHAGGYIRRVVTIQTY